MPEKKNQTNKTIATSIIIILVLFFFYLSLANKAQKVKAVRLRMAYEESKISKAQYEILSKENTLIRMLADPKYVFEVD